MKNSVMTKANEAASQQLKFFNEMMAKKELSQRCNHDYSFHFSASTWRSFKCTKCDHILTQDRD